MTHVQECACRDAAERRDPTGTSSIRKGFDREAIKRFRNLRALVQRVLIDMDVLGFKGTSMDNMGFVRLYTGDGSGGDDNSIIDFTPSGDKARAFNTWLKQGVEDVVLGSVDWHIPYIAKAYERGVNDAARRMSEGMGKTVNTDLNRAIHWHTLSQIQARTRDEFVNVAETMGQKISQVLAQGLLDNLDATTLCQQLLHRVDSIGIMRARLVVSTEIISAYNEAAINAYDEGGIRRLGVLAEYVTGKPRQEAKDKLLPDTPRPDFGPGIYKRGPKKGEPKKTSKWPAGRWPKVAWVTAGDDWVCEQCAALEDQIFTLETARGMLPLHPNCRCALYPLEEIDDESEAA